jgi:hypothetical protein
MHDSSSTYNFYTHFNQFMKCFTKCVNGKRNDRKMIHQTYTTEAYEYLIKANLSPPPNDIYVFGFSCGAIRPPRPFFTTTLEQTQYVSKMIVYSVEPSGKLPTMQTRSGSRVAEENPLVCTLYPQIMRNLRLAFIRASNRLIGDRGCIQDSDFFS